MVRSLNYMAFSSDIHFAFPPCSNVPAPHRLATSIDHLTHLAKIRSYGHFSRSLRPVFECSARHVRNFEAGADPCYASLNDSSIKWSITRHTISFPFEIVARARAARVEKRIMLVFADHRQVVRQCSAPSSLHNNSPTRAEDEVPHSQAFVLSRTLDPFPSKFDGFTAHTMQTIDSTSFPALLADASFVNQYHHRQCLRSM